MSLSCFVSLLSLSCPFDYIKVYDGDSAEDYLIGTYCGQQRNLVVYSSGENLFVEFHTLQRTADSQNRGFAGWFEFSERFVNLGKTRSFISCPLLLLVSYFAFVAQSMYFIFCLSSFLSFPFSC